MRRLFLGKHKQAKSKKDAAGKIKINPPTHPCSDAKGRSKVDDNFKPYVQTKLFSSLSPGIPNVTIVKCIDNR